MGDVTAPSEPVRPADEETVHDVAVAINASSRRVGWSEALWYADAAVQSEPWQRREKLLAQREEEAEGYKRLSHRALDERDQAIRERDEARAAVARVEALAENFNALEHDHGIGDGHDACGACWVEDITRAVTGNFDAALRGDAEEASEQPRDVCGLACEHCQPDAFHPCVLTEGHAGYHTCEAS